jgi:hypothetical protein
MRVTASSAARCMVFGLVAFTQLASAAANQVQRPHRPIPMSLLEEHAEIIMSLRTVSEIGGDVAGAAREVLALLEPHMQREQQLALAPLRLLPRLVNADVADDMAPIIAVTERLRAELPAFQKEHAGIRRALESLGRTAWREGKPEYAFLADRINRHIRVDEEVLFPAALLVGEYLRLVVREPSHTPRVGDSHNAIDGPAERGRFLGPPPRNFGPERLSSRFRAEDRRGASGTATTT